MTADQIREFVKTRTPAEINALIAERVMGYRPNASGHSWVVEHGVEWPKHLWAPWEYIADAMMVVDKLSRFCSLTRWADDCWEFEIWDGDTDDGRTEIIADAMGETREQAICLAALLTTAEDAR